MKIQMEALPACRTLATLNTTILRSADSRLASPADINLLRDRYMVDLVIDVRSPAEIAAYGPSELAQIARTYLPLYIALPAWDTDLLRMLEPDSLTEWAVPMIEALNQTNGAALIHGQMGGHRTSLACWVLEILAGISPEAAALDWADSITGTVEASHPLLEDEFIIEFMPQAVARMRATADDPSNHHRAALALALNAWETVDGHAGLRNRMTEAGVNVEALEGACRRITSVGEVPVLDATTTLALSPLLA